MAASTTLPGARVASPTKRAEASWTSTRPPGASRNARVARRAEAVLQRAQRPVRALALALELEHAVDQVLEHARAGERALLGDVADEEDGDAACLGEPRDAVGDLSHLADRPGGAGEVGRVKGLHRVDHADLGPLGVQRREHRAEVGLRQHRDLERCARQPLGAQPDLRGRLLARDIERAPAGALEVAERHRGQRRLADPRRAADQHERAGHEAAAEDPVELDDARRSRATPGTRGGAVAGQRAPRPGAPGAALCRRARLLDECVPLAAAGALAVPGAGLGVAAGEQSVDGRRDEAMGRGQ